MYFPGAWSGMWERQKEGLSFYIHGWNKEETSRIKIFRLWDISSLSDIPVVGRCAQLSEFQGYIMSTRIKETRGRYGSEGSTTTTTTTKHKDTQTHVCTALKTDLHGYTHLFLSNTHTHKHANRCTCTVPPFKAAPVTLPVTRVHSQPLLPALKRWGTWCSVSLLTFAMNTPHSIDSTLWLPCYKF